MAKPQCPYTCHAVSKVDGVRTVCGKPCTAAPDDVLALLLLCKECASKRYRAGKAAQREAQG